MAASSVLHEAAETHQRLPHRRRGRRRAGTARVAHTARGAVGIGVVLGASVIFAGNTDLQKGDNGGLGPAIFTAVLLVVLAALFWFVVLPRVQNVDRTVIIISIVALLPIVAFWRGITPLLAAAAVAVAGKGSTLGTTTLALEVLAVLAAAATVVVSVMESQSSRDVSRYRGARRERLGPTNCAPPAPRARRRAGAPTPPPAPAAG